MTDSLTLSHLRMLEAESIHILREVVAEFHHHVEHAQHGARGLAGGIGQRRHGMKGPVEIGGAVDQDERGLGHGKGLLMGGAWSWEPGHGKRRIVAELHII